MSNQLGIAGTISIVKPVYQTNQNLGNYKKLWARDCIYIIEHSSILQSWLLPLRLKKVSKALCNDSHPTAFLDINQIEIVWTVIKKDVYQNEK